MVNAFINLFAFHNILSFAVGVICTMAYYKWKDHMADEKDPEHAPHTTHFKTIWLAGFISFSMILYIGVRTQMASNEIVQAKDQAVEITSNAQSSMGKIRSCEKEFQDSVQISRQIFIQNEALATRERDGLRQLVERLLSIDPNLPNDIKNQISRQMLQEYDDLVNVTNKERADNEIARAQHPLTDPKCTELMTGK